MNFRLIQSEWHSIECDALLMPIFNNDDLRSGLVGQINQRLDGLLEEMNRNGEWKAELDEIATIHRPAGLPMGRLILVGAGRSEDYNSDRIREVMTRAVNKLKTYKLRRVAIFRRSSIEATTAAQAAVEGVVLGSFEPDEHKTKNRSLNRLEEIVFASNQPLCNETINSMKWGEKLAHATNRAKSLVIAPANLMNPTKLAEEAREMADRVGLEIEVLDEKALEADGFNALLGVAQGSEEPACLIVLKHFKAPNPDSPPVALLGKGVTFDAGGLCLKPATNMEEMKTDKAGACAVMGAMEAIALLELPVNAIGVIPAVENLPGGRAQRPGDVIRAMNGKTIEIINTDAEGRLILADALCYARRFKPSMMIDLATLTGACVVALGKLRAGVFANEDNVCRLLFEAAERAGEKYWRFPMDDDYKKDLESEIADIRNVGLRWAGAITAAKFLEEFVGDTPWCHVDIAGVDLYPEKHPIKGPTGFGVRTLVELVAFQARQDTRQEVASSTTVKG